MKLLYAHFLVISLLSGSCTAQDLWNGNFYCNNSSTQQQTALKILHEYVVINPSDNVLDIGCGSGEISNYIASLVPSGSVLGIDTSESMIIFAQEKFKEIPNLTFNIVDAQQWFTENKTFDLIVSFSALHWMKNQQAVFNHIAKSLNPNGTFVAALAHTKHYLYESVKTVAQSTPWKSYFNDPSLLPWYPNDEQSITQLFGNAGLKPIRIEVWRKPHNYTSKELFASYLNGWADAIEHVQMLPESLRPAFIANVIDGFLKSIDWNPNKPIQFLSHVLLIKAKKLPA